MSYVLSFLIAACLAGGLTPLVRYLAKRVGAIDQPGGRKVHRLAVPRIGGLSVMLSIALTILAVSELESRLPAPEYLLAMRHSLPQWIPIFLGGAIVFSVGLWDDFQPLPVWVKFLCQAAAAGVAMGYGARIDQVSFFGHGPFSFGLLALPCTFVWIVGITNAFNFIDGLDGLATGLAIIAAGTCAVAFFSMGNVSHTLFLFTLLGALVGFLPYNFNPARIFLGDSGSLLVGYMLAVIAVTGPGKKVTALAVMFPCLLFGLPIFDTGLTILRRFVSGVKALVAQQFSPKAWLLPFKQMFEADQRHIHHRFLAHGLSHRGTVLLLYILSMILSCLALLTILANATTQ